LSVLNFSGPDVREKYESRPKNHRIFVNNAILVAITSASSRRRRDNTSLQHTTRQDLSIPTNGQPYSAR
jgi:hypothetical protein